MRIKLLSILFFCARLIYGQSEFIELKTVEVQAGQISSVEFPKGLSSVVIRSVSPVEGIRLVYANEEVILSQDPHIDGFASNQIHFSEEIREFSVLSPEERALEIIGLSVPKLNIKLPTTFSNVVDSCKKPPGIEQSVWRAGLPPPAPNPTLNVVNHCIIHHSAGSNTATDYTEVVRNIYIYHTNVNGWDDIGYNFLIAPDGTLFHGRDGQGLMADDNVRGAHYCGKNSGTMGVCLLGNFMTVLPQQAALDMLEDLLLWKLNKESLNPADSANHPLPGGAFLGRIAGHRDGCATDCPGTFLYTLLPAVIDSVDNRIGSCPPVTGDALIEASGKQISIYPNPANSKLNIETKEPCRISIVDLSGKVYLSRWILKGHTRLDIPENLKGIYILKISTRDYQFNQNF